MRKDGRFESGTKSRKVLVGIGRWHEDECLRALATTITHRKDLPLGSSSRLDARRSRLWLGFLQVTIGGEGVRANCEEDRRVGRYRVRIPRFCLGESNHGNGEHGSPRLVLLTHSPQLPTDSTLLRLGQ
jgi:hypothetical protein